MKKIVLIIAVFIAFSFTKTQNDIPNEFKMSEKYFSIGTDFSINSGSQKLGVIEQRTLNFTNTFEYFDNNHTLKAKAVQKAFSWGVEIVIYDQYNKIIGYIKEDVISSMFSMSTIYHIQDSNKKEIGVSKKLDYFGTDIEIFINGKNVVQLTRPYFNLLTDEWTVKISDNSIDKRILVFIPAYKTCADNKRKK